MDEALALGQLLREDRYQRDAQEVGRLERHADHRNPNPARRAVQVDPDKKGQQHEQQRGDEHQSQQPGPRIALVVESVHRDHRGESEHDELQLGEKVMRRVAPGLTVGHRRRRREDHEQRSDRQNRDNHPQHAVSPEKTVEKPRLFGRFRPKAPAFPFSGYSRSVPFHRFSFNSSCASPAGPLPPSVPRNGPDEYARPQASLRDTASPDHIPSAPPGGSGCGKFSPSARSGHFVPSALPPPEGEPRYGCRQRCFCESVATHSLN